MSMNLQDPTIDLRQGSYWRSLTDITITGFFLNREDRDDAPLILPAFMNLDAPETTFILEQVKKFEARLEKL